MTNKMYVLNNSSSIMQICHISKKQNNSVNISVYQFTTSTKNEANIQPTMKSKSTTVEQRQRLSTHGSVFLPLRYELPGNCHPC